MRLLILIGFLLFIVSCGSKEDDIATLLKWSGMNKLPGNAKVIEVKRDLRLGSQDYEMTFTASNESIENWIRTSKGAQGVIPTGDNELKYILTPYDCAEDAFLFYNKKKKSVVLKADWD